MTKMECKICKDGLTQDKCIEQLYPAAFSRKDKCPRLCHNCSGSGYLYETYSDPEHVVVVSTIECPECNGTKYINTQND